MTPIQRAMVERHGAGLPPGEREAYARDVEDVLRGIADVQDTDARHAIAVALTRRFERRRGIAA